MMKGARDSQLKAAIETHMSQTEEHLHRLERVADLGSFRPFGSTCLAAAGLNEEACALIGDCIPGATMDAAIISCLQKAEHYEICSYGTVLVWADALGNQTAVDLLRHTLEEEAMNDELLSAIAEEVSTTAAQGFSLQVITGKREMVEATS